jgi:hypothetical protein
MTETKLQECPICNHINPLEKSCLICELKGIKSQLDEINRLNQVEASQDLKKQQQVLLETLNNAYDTILQKNQIAGDTTKQVQNTKFIIRPTNTQGPWNQRLNDLLYWEDQ